MVTMLGQRSKSFAAVGGAPQDGVAVGGDLRGDGGPYPPGWSSDRGRSVPPPALGGAGEAEAWVKQWIMSGLW